MIRNHIGKITPIDAMIYAIEMIIGPVGGEKFKRHGSYFKKPGAVIERMPAEWREKLAELKSSDFDKMWFWEYFDDAVYYGKLTTKEKFIEFDKKLRK